MFLFYNTKKIIKLIFSKETIIDVFLLFSILIIPIILALIYFFTYTGSSLEKSINVIDQIPLFTFVLSSFFSFIWQSKKFHNLKYKNKQILFSRKDFIISYVLISFMWYIFIYVYIIIILMCFLNTKIFLFKIVMFGQWFYSHMILFFSSTTISILLIVLIKNFKLLLTINIFYIIISMFLSDQLFQYELIANYNFISYIALISPLNYSLSLMSNATNVPDFLPFANFFAIKKGMNIEQYILSSDFNVFYENLFIRIYGLNIFDINNAFCINSDSILKIVFNRWQKILNLVVPFLFIISMWPISYIFYYDKLSINKNNK